MQEVELKFSVAEGQLGRLVAAMLDLGAVRQLDQTQIDHYMDPPGKNLKQTGEAFRLRRQGSQNKLTYKGPVTSDTVKTREEIEIALATGEDQALETLQMFKKLGFSPVGTVQKYRTPYTLNEQGQEYEIAIDHLVGLGYFVEIEVLTSVDNLTEAEKAVQNIATRLGLSYPERQSYLALIRATRGFIAW